MRKGSFLVLEGVEGSGKGTILNLITDYLSKQNIDFVKTREPGGTFISEKIRDIIVNENIDGVTEAYLFASARRDHVENLIKPALQDGRNVLCDRFVYSSLAYQGHARGLGMDFIAKLNEPVINGCYPDTVIYLDLKPEIGLERIRVNNREENRLDNESIEFHRKVREGYLMLADLEPEKFVVINADRTPEEIFNEIVNKVLIKLN